MRISDIIQEEPEELEKESSELNLEEVEKTAELLESLSEEDTLLDDLAKLAVFQDLVEADPKLIKEATKKYNRNN